MRDWIEEDDQEEDYPVVKNDELEEGEISKFDKLTSYFDIDCCGV